MFSFLKRPKVGSFKIIEMKDGKVYLMRYEGFFGGWKYLHPYSYLTWSYKIDFGSLNAAKRHIHNFLDRKELKKTYYVDIRENSHEIHKKD